MVKYFKNYFRNLKLYKKMLSVYILIFGAFCVISIGAMQITLAIYDDKIYQKSLQELNYFMKTIEMDLNNVEGVSYSVAMDYDIQKQLSSMMELDNHKEYLLKMASFRNRLLVEVLSADSLTDILYTDRKDTSFEVGKKSLVIPEETYHNILEKAKTAKGGYVYVEPSLDFPYLVSGRNIREHIDSSLDYLGTLLFTSSINAIIDRNLDALESGNSNLCIFSENGILYRNNEELFPEVPEIPSMSGYKITNINNNKYFMCYQKSQVNGWTYVNLFPYDSIYYLNTFVRYLMVLGFLVLFIAAFFILKKISISLTFPLEQLTTSMGIVERGEFEQAISYLSSEETMDEIGYLKKDFQIMLDKIKVLIHENYEKQLMLKDTQYKALQAQINPHFLYNTLNSVNWMIKASRNTEASKMIMALGNLLHAALKKEPFISIKEELELLNNYIAIQKVRYQSRVVFIIKEEGNLSDYVMPRMILQPLVENSIYYGVEETLDLCTIKVSIREEEEQIVFWVEDDGPGIKEDRLEKIRCLEMKPKGKGIGLKNIQERLALMFEDNYKFYIDSVYGEGTKITITISKYRGEKTV